MDYVRDEISALLSIHVVANVPQSKCKLTFGLCIILHEIPVSNDLIGGLFLST